MISIKVIASPVPLYMMLHEENFMCGKKCFSRHFCCCYIVLK